MSDDESREIVELEEFVKAARKKCGANGERGVLCGGLRAALQYIERATASPPAEVTREDLQAPKPELKNRGREYDGPTAETGSPEPSARADRFVNASETLDELPEAVSFLGRGLLERGGLGLLVGRPYVGKSWAALQLCHAVATGRDWYGIPTSGGCVGFLSLELPRFRLRERLQVIDPSGEGAGKHRPCEPSQGLGQR